MGTMKMCVDVSLTDFWASPIRPRIHGRQLRPRAFAKFKLFDEALRTLRFVAISADENQISQS